MIICDPNRLRREDRQIVPLSLIRTVNLNGQVSSCVVLYLGFHAGFVLFWTKSWNELFCLVLNTMEFNHILYFAWKLLLFQ